MSEQTLKIGSTNIGGGGPDTARLNVDQAPQAQSDDYSINKFSADVHEEKIGLQMQNEEQKFQYNEIYEQFSIEEDIQEVIGADPKLQALIQKKMKQQVKQAFIEQFHITRQRINMEPIKNEYIEQFIQEQSGQKKQKQQTENIIREPKTPQLYNEQLKVVPFITQQQKDVQEQNQRRRTTVPKPKIKKVIEQEDSYREDIFKRSLNKSVSLEKKEHYARYRHRQFAYLFEQNYIYYREKNEKFLFECMDILMFLNHANDNYLQLQDFEPLIKHAKQKLTEEQVTREEVIYKFESHNPMKENYIDFWQFTCIMEDLKLDTQKISQEIVRTEETNNLKNEYFRENNQHKQSKTSFFFVIANVSNSGLYLFDKGFDCYLLKEFYSYTQKEQNLANQKFRILLFWLFMNFMANFLISYSSMLHSLCDATTVQTKVKIASMSGIFLSKDKILRLRNKFTSFYKKIGLGMTAHEVENQYYQRKVADLLLTTFSSLLLKSLVYLGVFSNDQSQEGDDLNTFLESDSGTMIIISICLDSADLVVVLYLMYCASQALDEEFQDYCILSLRGLQKWIPYTHLIQKRKLERVKVDYSSIKLKLPGITDQLGIYFTLQEYQFNDSKIVEFIKHLQTYQSNQIIKKQQQETKGLAEIKELLKGEKTGNLRDYQFKMQKQINMIDIGQSVNYVSINRIINLMNVINEEGIDQIRILFSNTDWKLLIENAKQNCLIPELYSYVAKTSAGKNLLQVCIDNEPEDHEEWILQSAFEELLNDGFNASVPIAIGGNSIQLIQYAKNNKKLRAVEILEQNVKKRESIMEQQNIDIYKLQNQENNNEKQEGNDSSLSDDEDDMAKQEAKIKRRIDLDIANQQKAGIFGNIFDYFFEIIATFDFITDMFFVTRLFTSKQGHNFWLVLTLYAIFSTYFVCYIPYIDFQRQMSLNKFLIQTEKRKGQKIKMWLLMTPLFVLYMISLDLVYLIKTVFIIPCIAIINKVFNKKKIDPEEMDKFFQRMFNMSQNQMKGFRRLRQVCQLNFESLPQIFLQIRILYYARNEQKDTHFSRDLDISEEQIMVSLAAAFIHIIGQYIMLNRESKACKMDFFEYLAVCYNGRLGWVPFINNFATLQSYQAFFKRWEIKSPITNTRSLVLDYDIIQYQFSPESSLEMIKALRFLPSLETCHEEDQLIIKIGKSFNHVSSETLYQLFEVAYTKKIFLDISTVDVSRIIDDIVVKHLKEDLKDEHLDYNECTDKLIDVLSQMHGEQGKIFIDYLKSKTVDEDWTSDPKFETICEHFFNKLIENKDKLPEYKLIIENLSKTQGLLDKLQYSKWLTKFQFASPGNVEAVAELVKFDETIPQEKRDQGDISHLIGQQLEKDLEEDKPDYSKSADGIISVLKKMEGEQTQFYTNLKSNIVQHNWIEDQKFRNIIQQFFNNLIDSKNQADSKMIIQNLQKCEGFLQHLQYQKRLCKYLIYQKNIENFISYAQFDDQEIQKESCEMLQKKLQQQEFLSCVYSILSTKDGLPQYKSSISIYMRQILSQFDDEGLQLFLQDQYDLIEFPENTHEFIEYNLFSKVVLTDHNSTKIDYKKGNLWEADFLEKYDVKGFLELNFQNPIYIRGFGFKAKKNQSYPKNFNIEVKIFDPKTRKQEKKETLLRKFTQVELKDQEIKRFKLIKDKSKFITSLKMTIYEVKIKNMQAQNKNMHIDEFHLYI